MGDFPDVLSNYLSKDMRVKGKPMNIKFTGGAEFTTFKVSRCRQVPLHIKGDADALLADLEENGVLRRFDCDETTENLSAAMELRGRICHVLQRCLAYGIVFSKKSLRSGVRFNLLVTM